MRFVFLRRFSWSHRAAGFLSHRWGLALGCGLLAVLLLTPLLCRCPAGERLDTRGWGPDELLDHLNRSGVQLRVVPAEQNGGPCDSLYLTEDPAATWNSLVHQMVTVERIHQWQGSVWVGRARHYIDVEDLLAQWGKHGCRIGDFLLFGDERVLRRIQEVCR